MPGTLYIVSAPSGAGKTSLVRALLAADPRVHLSISHTTRAPRPGEVDGRDYHFVDAAAFDGLVAADAFLEHADVFGRRYGTSRAAVEPFIERGEDVFLDIDWQGAQQVRERWQDCVSVFILPPSREILLERLRHRGQDSEETIARRIAGARADIERYREYDYLIVNDVFDDALADLRAVVTAQRLRQPAQAQRHAELIAALLRE
ncbi:MAG TPA: guanylate kinase [Xanthomonadaceae bacterium]|nr:guanylate kinase [Xanthomonadaceae bacterium]